MKIKVKKPYATHLRALFEDGAVMVDGKTARYLGKLLNKKVDVGFFYSRKLKKTMIVLFGWHDVKLVKKGIY